LFVLIMWRTRYVSLGSICAAAFVPVWTALQHLFIAPVSDFAPVVMALCATSAIIIARHRENIKRLLAGTENRFGSPAKPVQI